MNICHNFFVCVLVLSVFMAPCLLACSMSTTGYPSVLTVSHCELLYETGLPAHKLKAILFTAISRFIDCLQLVTVLAMLKARHLQYYSFLVMFLVQGQSCMNACSVSSDVMGLDLRVTISELLTGFSNILCMDRSNIFFDFWISRFTSIIVPAVANFEGTPPRFL